MKEFYGYIYKTTNLKNNKIYIGKRKGKFCLFYLGSGKLIKQAINKNGKNNFKVEVICYAKDKQELNELEIYHIQEHRKINGVKNLYNIGNGGEEGWDVVLNHSNKDEINHLKIIKRNKTVFSNEENRSKLSKKIELTYNEIPNLRENRKSHIKKIWQDENYRKNQEAGRNKRRLNGWFSKETIDKMSLSHKGQKARNRINVDVDRSIDLYKSGLSIKEISKILNVKDYIIRSRFKEINFKLKKQKI